MCSLIATSPFTCRPLSKEEVANGVQQVINCNERAREVVVTQNVGGKQLGRSFHFDKVCLGRIFSQFRESKPNVRTGLHPPTALCIPEAHAPTLAKRLPSPEHVTLRRCLTQRQDRPRFTRWP